MAETTADVIFSDRESASVRVDSSATGETARAAQVAMWSLFAGHLLADIGPKAWAVELSTQLGAMSEQERSEFIAADDVKGVRVVSGSPPAPRVGFGAWLSHEDDVRPGFFLLADQRHWRLKIQMSWRERRRANHYFGTAPALLLHNLLRQDVDDANQQARLFDAADAIAKLHRNRELRLPVAWTHAVTLAAERVWTQG